MTDVLFYIAMGAVLGLGLAGGIVLVLLGPSEEAVRDYLKRDQE